MSAGGNGREELVVTSLATLEPADRSALSGLLTRAEEVDGHPALPEPQRLALLHPTRPVGERLVLARGPGGEHLVRGCALLSPGRDGSTVVHVVVDPASRHDDAQGGAVAGSAGDLTTALARRAVAESAADHAVEMWAMQASRSDDRRAAALGFDPERDLLQMRVPLPLDPGVMAATRPLATRPFVPGRDEGVWVDTNNRAFATHPEQGGWTVDQLRDRMNAPWVELKGFLVADDPDGPGLIGFCWTKVHRAATPVLGEIYVVAVDPRHHGHGWGRSLTVAGLESLAGRGVHHGMLYTDADNEAAVSLYRSLGFTVDHVDRCYRRDPRRGAPS